MLRYSISPPPPSLRFAVHSALASRGSASHVILVVTVVVNDEKHRASRMRPSRSAAQIRPSGSDSGGSRRYLRKCRLWPQLRPKLLLSHVVTTHLLNACQTVDAGICIIASVIFQLQSQLLYGR